MRPVKSILNISLMLRMLLTGRIVGHFHVLIFLSYIMSEHVEHHFGEPMEPDLDGSYEPMQQLTIGDRMPHTRATMSLKGRSNMDPNTTSQCVQICFPKNG